MDTINKKNPEELNEFIYKQGKNWSKIFILTLSSSIGITLIYSFFAKIDEVITTFGELQPIGGEIPIKASESGYINEIFVNEGDLVEENQELISIGSEILDQEKKKLSINLDSLKRSIDLQKELVESHEFLVAQGAVSKFDFLTQENKLQEMESEFRNVEVQIKEIDIQKSNYNLRAPVKGNIFNLIPTSRDYFVQSGETLLNIIPTSKLEAKIYLLNKDIGFVKEKMPSEIRIDAYPFTEFGSIQGTLKSIGDESLPADSQNPQSRFPAYVSLDNQFLRKGNQTYQIKSGQSITVNLLVRNKPLITILFDPFVKIFDSLRGIRTIN